MDKATEIFGTYYFTLWWGVVFVAPGAFLFLLSILWALGDRIASRKLLWGVPSFFAICTLAVAFVCFWDVYQIGQQATRLCREEAGLYIYRTAEAEGVAGFCCLESLGRYGFKYIEEEFGGGDKIREFYDEDGKVTRKTVYSFISRYEFFDERIPIAPKIDLLRGGIKDRFTNKILGEYKRYSIDGGWVDMAFFGLTGFTYSPWICDEGKKTKKHWIDELITGVLQPPEE